jgi:hypothetical protein
LELALAPTLPLSSHPATLLHNTPCTSPYTKTWSNMFLLASFHAGAV